MMEHKSIECLNISPYLLRNMKVFSANKISQIPGN
jgi:hypothetical protein